VAVSHFIRSIPRLNIGANLEAHSCEHADTMVCR
jgi:hypothetical protein